MTCIELQQLLKEVPHDNQNETLYFKDGKGRLFKPFYLETKTYQNQKNKLARNNTYLIIKEI